MIAKWLCEAMPTARQLEVFIAVAAAGSVRKAADGLQISQPSVSKLLRALERRVGGELLVRQRGAKARLSPLGEAVLEDARQTLEGQRRITRRILSAETQRGPRLFVRPFMLESIRKRLPEMYRWGLPSSTAFTVVDDTDDIFMRVEVEPSAFTVVRADLPPDNPDLKVTILRRESASLYASPELLTQLEREDGGFGRLPILVPGLYPARSGWTRRVVSRAGIDAPKWQRGSQFLDLLLEDVAGGAGGAIFIDWHVRPAVESGRIAPVAGSTVPISVMLVSGSAADEATRQALLESFRAFYAD